MQHFDLYLRDRIHDLDVAIKDLALRYDVSVLAKIYLIADELITHAEKFVNAEDATLVLNAESANTLKTAYEHLQHASQLVSDVDKIHFEKVVGAFGDKLHLDSNTIMLIYEYLYSCSVLRNQLISSSVGADIEAAIHPKDVWQLVTANTAIPLAKKEAYPLRGTLQLVYDIGCVLECLLDAEKNTLILSSAAGSAIVRFRLLEEMDADKETAVDLTLSEFDNMTLEDIDFIILEE